MFNRNVLAILWLGIALTSQAVHSSAAERIDTKLRLELAVVVDAPEPTLRFSITNLCGQELPIEILNVLV